MHFISSFYFVGGKENLCMLTGEQCKDESGAYSIILMAREEIGITFRYSCCQFMK